MDFLIFLICMSLGGCNPNEGRSPGDFKCKNGELILTPADGFSEEELRASMEGVDIDCTDPENIYEDKD